MLILSIVIILFLVYFIFLMTKTKKKTKNDLNFKKNLKINSLKVPVSKLWEKENYKKGVPHQIVGSKYFSKENYIIFDYIKLSHSFIVGGSGTGKTEKYFKTNIITNALVKDKPFMIINDLKSNENNLNSNNSYGSLYQDLSGFLKKHDYSIYRLNFNFIKGRKKNSTHQFNIMKNIFDNRKNKFMVDFIIEDFLEKLFPKNKEKDDYWVNSSRLISKSIIEYMIEVNITKKNFNLSTFIDLWKNFEDLLSEDSFMKEFSSKETIARKNLISKTKNLMESRSFSEIKASLDSELKKIDNIVIKTLTIFSSFDFEKFFSSPSVLFLQTNGYNEGNNKLISLIISQLIEYKKENVSNEKSLILFLDEFNGLAKINELSDYLDTLRSKNIFLHLGVQSIFKFEEKYGDIEKYANNFGYSFLFGSTTNKKELDYFNPYIQNVEQKTFTYSSDGELNSTSKSKGDEKKISDYEIMTNKNFVFFKKSSSELQKINFEWINLIHQYYYLPFELNDLKLKSEKKSFSQRIQYKNSKIKTQTINKIVEIIQKNELLNIEESETLRESLEAIENDNEWKENVHWKLYGYEFSNEYKKTFNSLLE